MGLVKKVFLKAILVFAFILGAVLFTNYSFWGVQPKGSVKILSHRGVHQTFDIEAVDNDSCTAAVIHPPRHSYLENTVESVEAAFDYGADAVEIDVIRTRDDDFVVFHDWTLGCRTNGEGRTRDFTLAELQSLDIGHGYSFDGGKTFPFRGGGAHMPSLAELLGHFSNRTFIVNVKSNHVEDAEVFAKYVRRHELATGNKLSLFSGPRFAQRWREIDGELVVGTKAEARLCVEKYLMLGWAGYVPDVCRITGLAVPVNLSWLYWGWPHLTLERMSKKDVDVILVGPMGKHLRAIDDVGQLSIVPEQFDGWIVTNQIELIGPALKLRGTE